VGKIRTALAEVADKIGLTEPLLRRARKRARKFRECAEREHKRQIKYQRRADECRRTTEEGGYPSPELAERFDRRAARCRHRAERSHLKAVYWRGRIKAHVQRLKHLRKSQAELEAELVEFQKQHGVTIAGNKASGGTPGQRWKAVCIASVKNCASGKRRNFYSMSGAWDIDSVIAPGEEYGQRSDCSSTVTGWALAAGLPDPNGEDWHGGYTGTLVGEHSGWKNVSRSAMESKGWGYVVYGGGVGHHVEAYIGPGDRTAGHGSAPVDFGVIDLFGGGDYRCFIYDPN
jgi:hypothetical protein